MTPSEAARRARIAFGHLDHIKEEYRDALGTRLLDDLKQDVGYGARALLRTPGFTCIALLTVGIGIGASSAIFSVLNAVLIRDLPYGDVTQLVYVGVRNTKLADFSIESQRGIGAFAPSNADFDDIRHAATSFSSLTIFAQDTFTLIDRDVTERIGGARVSGAFFRTLEAQPEIGRVLGPDDDGLGRPRVTVISHRLWQTAFGGAPDILTRQLSLGGGAYDVVGVVPPLFLYPRASDVGPDAVSKVTDVWIPMALTAQQRAERDFSNNTGALFPALTMSRTEIGDVIKRAGSARTTRTSRMCGALVVLQVSLAVLLVAGATLLLESYRNVLRAERGFSSSALTLRISLDARYREPERRRTFFRQMLSDVRALPNVDAAGGVNALPLSGSEAISFFTLDGFANKTDQMVNTRWVSAQYFDAMGTRVKEGRAIEDSDVEGRPPVVVVNEAFASRYYPGASAVGRRFRIGGLHASDPPRPWSTIVGVVADVRHSNLEDTPPPQVYSSVYQGEPMDSLYVAVRTRVVPDAMVSTVRRTIRNIDPRLALADIHVMGELVSEATARRRFQTTLLTAFGVVALALAAVGLYGLMSYTVRQRTREIGVRLALGARTSDVLLLVAGQGARVMLLGIPIGTVAALVLARVLASTLYGVAPTDPGAIIVTGAVLTGTAMLACLMPARRAIRLDPVNTLRED